MKVGVKTEMIESMLFNMQRLSMDVDELQTALHYLYSELSEEQVMLLKPQTHRAIDSLGMAAGRMYKLNDEVAEFVRVLQCVNSSYCECDKGLSAKIDELTAELKVLSDCSAAILAPSFTAGTESSDEEQCSASLADVIARENTSLEMANLAAISTVISEEYGDEEET